MDETASATVHHHQSSDKDDRGAEDERVLKVQDLVGVGVTDTAGGGSSIPSQIQYLMSLKGDKDFISVHEWSARLVHAMLVEAGFFPVFEGPLDITTFEALTMPEPQRLSLYTKKLTSQVMFSDQGLYVLKYQVVLSKLVDVPIEEGDQNVVDSYVSSNSVVVEGVASEASSQETETKRGETEGETEVEQKWEYYFSKDITVTVLIMNDGLLISAYYPSEEGRQAINHQIKLNIEEFFTTRATLLPVKLRPNQWIRKCDLNALRYAGFFKNRFAYYLMDLLDGILFEKRGLISLPSIILPQILKYSRVQDVLNFGMTCSYFYEVSRNEKLWEFLLHRDFPSTNSRRSVNQVSTAAATSSPFVIPLMAPPPPPPPPPTPLFGPELPQSQPESFYEQYKQKYQARHRTAHRFRPIHIPGHFRPHRNIGRRHPSLPLDVPFVRF